MFFLLCGCVGRAVVDSAGVRCLTQLLTLLGGTVSFWIGVSSSRKAFLCTAIKELLASSRFCLPEHLQYRRMTLGVCRPCRGVILATWCRSLSSGGVWMGRLLASRMSFSRLQGSPP